METTEPVRLVAWRGRSGFSVWHIHGETPARLTCCKERAYDRPQLTERRLAAVDFEGQGLGLELWDPTGQHAPAGFEVGELCQTCIRVFALDLADRFPLASVPPGELPPVVVRLLELARAARRRA